VTKIGMMNVYAENQTLNAKILQMK